MEYSCCKIFGCINEKMLPVPCRDEMISLMQLNGHGYSNIFCKNGGLSHRQVWSAAENVVLLSSGGGRESLFFLLQAKHLVLPPFHGVGGPPSKLGFVEWLNVF